jgi:hypothetical protein
VVAVHLICWPMLRYAWCPASHLVQYDENPSRCFERITAMKLLSATVDSQHETFVCCAGRLVATIAKPSDLGHARCSYRFVPQALQCHSNLM